jgi:amino acid transporter
MNPKEVQCLLLVDNGGPPGVLYEFLVAAFYYCFIASSIAELSIGNNDIGRYS